MDNKKVKRGYWNVQRSFEEAKKYKHRSTFKKESGRAYSVLRENHLLDEACKHMIKMDTITKWTKENCIEAAKQCKTKSEFNSKFCGAMTIAKKRGWYNELLQYFTPVGSKYKRCIYVCEFSDNHAYVSGGQNIHRKSGDLGRERCPETQGISHPCVHNDHHQHSGGRCKLSFAGVAGIPRGVQYQ